jgi:hypothetical protein
MFRQQQRERPMERLLVTVASVAVALVWATTAWADRVVFTPFLDLSVCPECPPPPSDVVYLTDGSVVHADVVSDNPTFYVLRRHGMFRAIGRTDVARIEWQHGQRPAGLGDHDQILLHNGHVLLGRIVSESESPPHYTLYSPALDQTYTVFKDQARMVYRSGQRQRL